MIEPFYFSDEQLYGIYHPVDDWEAEKLLVICPPLFDEYRRTYRAFYELSISCAQESVHVLRFDYPGTGESKKKLEEASIQDWTNSIEAAIEEGISISGASNVILLATRFGATLASAVSHPSISRRIYWDPILSGQQYIEQLQATNTWLKDDYVLHLKTQNLRPESIEVENFHLPAQLQSELQNLNSNVQADLKDANCFVVTTDPGFCEAQDVKNCEFAGFNYDWPPYHDGLLLPSPVLTAIAERVVRK